MNFLAFIIAGNDFSNRICYSSFKHTPTTAANFFELKEISKEKKKEWKKSLNTTIKPIFLCFVK